jgi:hypothetical protein
LSLRSLQLVLVVAAVAPIVVTGELFWTAVRVCLGVMVAVAWLTEPERRRRGGGWWMLVAVGPALPLAAFAVEEISEPAETAAGIVAIAAAALIIIGATIGFPLD